jgi:hypothetical protein
MEANLCRFILYRFVYKLFSRDILLSRGEGDGILLSRGEGDGILLSRGEGDGTPFID